MAFVRWISPSLALAAIVAGHPAERRNLAKYDEVTVYDSAVAAPTHAFGPVVWEDKAGKPLSTTTESILILPTSLRGANMTNVTVTTMTSSVTRTVLLAPATGSAVAAQAHVLFEQNASSGAVTDSGHGDKGGDKADGNTSSGSSSHGDSSSSNNNSSNSDSTGLPGISYAPYRANSDCKSQDDIDSDFQHLKGSYSMVRIYGTDCDQVSKIHSAAKQIGVKLFLGIFDLDQAEDEANKIVSGMNGDWDMVHTVSVGNELVNTGKATPSQVISAMKAVRPILQAGGYTGPVVTVDTFNAAEANPELCRESDYCAVNAHPFFDSTVSADQAGPWLTGTVNRIKSSIGSKKVMITETGWPTQGAENGNAIPSLGNQKAALQSIRSAFADNPGDLILFSAFNDLWKQKEMSTFDADQFWGIDGAVSSSDS